jgi:hypothetical protein
MAVKGPLADDAQLVVSLPALMMLGTSVSDTLERLPRSLP